MNFPGSRIFPLAAFLVISFCLIPHGAAFAAAQSGGAAQASCWWIWPAVLFIVTFLLGVLAVLGGVGGGVLFVPIVGGFFPFHLDFERGAGLLVALSGALAAGPGLLKKGIADLRLAMPLALISSACAIVGAVLGLNLPTNVVQTSLGLTILGLMVIMLLAKRTAYPGVDKQDSLGTALRLSGIYFETSTGQTVDWKVHRTPQGLASFIVIGVIAGMFGLGAGWANVPVLNVMMGAPLKVSVATSKFLISITDSSAAWIYVNNGGILPAIVIPSIAGIMLGSLVGVRMLSKAKPAAVRYIVIFILFFSGMRALLKGLGVWN